MTFSIEALAVLRDRFRRMAEREVNRKRATTPLQLRNAAPHPRARPRRDRHDAEDRNAG